METKHWILIAFILVFIFFLLGPVSIIISEEHDPAPVTKAEITALKIGPFPTGKAVVPQPQLAGISPEDVIAIIGYASPPGPDDLNMRLSFQRAKAVARWLKVPATVPVTAGGETRAFGPTPKDNQLVVVLMKQLE